MHRVAILFLTTPFLAACAQEGALRMTAHASLGCSSTDYKDSRFSGSTDDGCGYKVVGRVGGGVMQPILDTPEKGEPVGGTRRPVNMLEAEAGYVRHGDMDFNGLWLGTSDRGTVKANGFILGAVYTRQISDRFDLFAGGGAHRWKVKENEVFGGVPESHDASGTSPYLDLGGRFWLNPNMAIRAAWERYFDIGVKDVTGKGDIDNLWLGLDYVF
jgi:hypothetical protein